MGESGHTRAEKGHDDVDIVGASDGFCEEVEEADGVEDGEDDGGGEGVDARVCGVVDGHGRMHDNLAHAANYTRPEAVPVA